MLFCSFFLKLNECFNQPETGMYKCTWLDLMVSTSMLKCDLVSHQVQKNIPIIASTNWNSHLNLMGGHYLHHTSKLCLCLFLSPNLFLYKAEKHKIQLFFFLQIVMFALNNSCSPALLLASSIDKFQIYLQNCNKFDYFRTNI